MVDTEQADLPLSQQCKLLELCRSSAYYKPVIQDETELANRIQEIYLRSDCRYGYRKMTASLKVASVEVNHKKVLRMMRQMGIQGLYPQKKVTTTTRENPRTYPYLLEGIKIHSPNQVWATDITYIRLPGRWMYFMAIIDLYSRYILAYELSSNLEALFCIDVLNRALRINTPLIFNTDQGSQFTSCDFIDVLIAASIQISMDHKGRCFDNILVERLWRTVKQEAIYYYRPQTVIELEKCIHQFVLWYNNERLHQALNYRVPEDVYMDST